MNNKIRSSSLLPPILLIVSGFVFASVSLSACAASGQSDQLVIAPLGSAGDTSIAGISRAELEDHVRRFADRYITRVALATSSVSSQSENAEHQTLMQDWKSVSYASVVDIAIGPNAVTNLLDMMALTRLSRLVVESYWVPEVLGQELGAGFLQTFVDLEEDIWTVADDVLTQEQQQELRLLVNEWHAENPDQIYPWYVRLSNFSGQRAASLAAVQQSGGMLKEVAKAREAAEEIQAFGERVLFYLQRAPMITSSEFKSSASDILSGPEMSKAMGDMDRFVTSVERLVDVVEKLPGGRLAAVDQFMDRVGEERQALFQDLASSEADIVDLLTALQPALDAIEKTVVVMKDRDPDAQPFDINDYRGLVADSTATAIELRRLVETIDVLLTNSSELTTVVAALVEAEHAVGDRIFLQLIALILIFFAALIGYRIVARKILPS